MMSSPFRPFVVAFALAAAGLAGGCATGAVSDRGYGAGAVPTKLTACYGYGCRMEKAFAITPKMSDRFAAIMGAGKASPQAEREAIRRAVAYYEDLSANAIGVRDKAKSPVVASGEKGQMDCIDESTNTRHILTYLANRGLITQHSVEQNVTRGALIDGRYPHWTAVVKDKADGKKWAVDSWYEPAGGLPDVTELAYWRTRGVWGER